MYEPPAEKYWCRMGVLTADFTTSVCVCVCVCLSMLTSGPDGFVKIDSLRRMSKVKDTGLHIAKWADLQAGFQTRFAHLF